MAAYEIAEAAADLENLLERVSQGEVIIITHNGIPCAKLIRYEEEHSSLQESNS